MQACCAAVHTSKCTVHCHACSCQRTAAWGRHGPKDGSADVSLCCAAGHTRNAQSIAMQQLPENGGLWQQLASTLRHTGCSRAGLTSACSASARRRSSLNSPLAMSAFLAADACCSCACRRCSSAPSCARTPAVGLPLGPGTCPAEGLAGDAGTRDLAALCGCCCCWRAAIIPASSSATVFSSLQCKAGQCELAELLSTHQLSLHH